MATENEEILDLISKRNDLQHQVTQAVLKNDPLEYVDIFSETVPEIIKIDKKINEWELKGNSRHELVAEIKTIHNNSESDLEKFERELVDCLKQSGHTSLNPLSKDRKRIDDLLKKSNPEGAASQMQKLTKHLPKLFRRGKELINRDRPDLAKGFWVQVAEAYGLQFLPPQWSTNNGSATSADTTNSIQIKTPDDFTCVEKEAYFDAIIRDVNHYFREVVENDREVEKVAENTFISVVSMLGSDAVDMLRPKIKKRNS